MRGAALLERGNRGFMAKGIKMKFVCKECGEEAKPDADKSTPNWSVYPTHCLCGGSFRVDVK
jgi:hypothetical protein